MEQPTTAGSEYVEANSAPEINVGSEFIDPQTTPNPEPPVGPFVNAEGRIEVRISTVEIRKRKLYVGVPMYGGICHGPFSKSMCDLTQLCSRTGIEMKAFHLFNESLITRARNYICDEFLRSDCTHLLFIDSDISFNPSDVLTLLALQGPTSEYDIIGAAYPKKCISWEKIAMAVNQGKAEVDPENLAKYVGDYVFNPKPGQGDRIELHKPVKVLELGTGFMMIRRQTLEKFAQAFPQYSYRPDHARSEHFDGRREIMQFFQAEIDPKSKRYLSEDYWFCQKIQELGMDTWLCPWIPLQHTGTMTYGGSLIDLAELGAAATVDPVQLQQIKDRRAAQMAHMVPNPAKQQTLQSTMTEVKHRKSADAILKKLA